MNGTGSLKCSKKNFEMINVAPGKDKECWCDEGQIVMNAKTVYGVKEYWRTQRIKLEEQEMIIIA